MASDIIHLEILNWEKYNPRGDVKKSSWFRFEHSIIDDPDFYEFDGHEFKAFIYILSQASRKNSRVIRINFDHALNASRIQKKSLLGAIEKLKELRIVLVHDTCAVRDRDVVDTSPLRDRDVVDTSTYATNERTNETNEDTCSVVEKSTPDPTTPEELKILVGQKNQETWATLYEDPEFVARELVKCLAYYGNNPKKKPKSKRGWVSATSGWLERSWTWRGKSIKGTSPPILNKPQVVSE